MEVMSKHSDASVSDFLNLVRTRLLDLNSGPSDDSKSEAVELVKKSIAEYRSNGCIPLQMIRTSIFLSPFFVGHVLPLLLSLSGEGEDVKDSLISELNR